ncbi:hypothetical protein G7Z17_g12887 [Cylindrodendrum hubeiense]|uniref:Small EDRK-rich factor-like N-terminal domain-containing protein n=1 Tax=Cylindrodendrum hubeiense TaxID=595255 RepID=A0A9P5H245_9HYPO|nr:hypothetical protein G7Z17_g12887 [Cylindrodendrum hubeiense]
MLRQKARSSCSPSATDPIGSLEITKIGSALPLPDFQVCSHCIFSLTLALSRLPQTLNDRPLPPPITVLPHSSVTMARGNQRDKAREAAQKKLAGQKKGNSMSGTEMQRAKESAAEIMRKKQAAAEAKKAEEATKK